MPTDAIPEAVPTVALSHYDIVQAIGEWVNRHRPGVLPSGRAKISWTANGDTKELSATVQSTGSVADAEG
jgi:hypothetical protein